MGTRAAWLSTKVWGWPAGGRRDPGGGVGREPPAAPSGDLPGLGRPSPTPPEEKGGVGGLPPPRPGGPGQALFSCLLFQSRAPHPKLREFGDSLGANECTQRAPHRQCRGCLENVYLRGVPSRPVILVPALGGRGRGGGVILPSCFRILGGAELGREEKGPRGEGTPKILRERVADRREVAQGAGNREEGGLEFPPAAHGSGVNSLRNLTEGADWHLPPVWHSQLPPPPFLGQPLILSLSGLPATLLLVTCTAPALGLDF